MPENNQFRIRSGMSVTDTNGNELGKLRSILTENETGVSRFITVGDRLLPVETIGDVTEDQLRLNIPGDRFVAFPERTGEDVPTVDELQRAYDAAGLEGPAVPDGGTRGQGD